MLSLNRDRNIAVFVTLIKILPELFMLLFRQTAYPSGLFLFVDDYSQYRSITLTSGLAQMRMGRRTHPKPLEIYTLVPSMS